MMDFCQLGKCEEKKNSETGFVIWYQFKLSNPIMYESLNWCCSQPLKPTGAIISANQKSALLREHPLYSGPVWDNDASVNFVRTSETGKL